MNVLLKVFLTIVIGLGISSEIAAQHTFEMMNGRLLDVFSYNDSAFTDIQFSYDKNSMKNERIRFYNENLRYDLAEKRGDDLSREQLDQLVEQRSKSLFPPKIKEGFVDRSEIFAIHEPDGTIEVVYVHADEIGNYYTVQEMQEFILGERDALLRFQSKRAFWGGVAFGAVGGFAWQNSVFSLTTPIVWTGITALPTIRIKDRYMSDPSLRTEPYKAGFAKTARTKNMLQGLMGSTVGTVAGLLIYAVVANNSSLIK